MVDHLDRDFFAVRFDRLTDSQKIYLRAMADLESGNVRSGAVADRLGISVEKLASRRKALINKGMIYSPRHGLAVFTVPEFGDFLRRQMPSLPAAGGG